MLCAAPFCQLRESQMAAGRLEHTAFASALDLGATAAEEAAGFAAGHPIRKQEVGRRLALNARAMIYGEASLARTREGPVVVNHTVVGHAGKNGLLGVVLAFETASATGLHLAGTAPCCTASVTLPSAPQDVECGIVLRPQ